MVDDEHVMNRAIQLALLAEREGSLPVGAIITLGDKVVAEGKNAIWVPRYDGTRHAEMEALRIVSPDLWQSSSEMSLYTTLEPCLMCFGSILLHGIRRIVYGASDSFGGASSVLSNLPPFFQEKMAQTEWIGPLMPDICDPLHERLLALEKAGKGNW